MDLCQWLIYEKTHKGTPWKKISYIYMKIPRNTPFSKTLFVLFSSVGTYDHKLLAIKNPNQYVWVSFYSWHVFVEKVPNEKLLKYTIVYFSIL